MQLHNTVRKSFWISHTTRVSKMLEIVSLLNLQKSYIPGETIRLDITLRNGYSWSIQKISFELIKVKFEFREPAIKTYHSASRLE